MIATPIILNLIETTRKGSVLRSAEGIVRAGNMYYMNLQLDGMGPKEISFSCTKDGCISDVIDENGEALKLDMDGNAGIGTVTIDVEGNISFKLEKNGYCTYKYAINNDINIIKGTCDNIGAVDDSGANIPELSGMTPVVYVDGSWQIADTSVSWYNYEEYEWANAVILTEEGKKKHEKQALNLETDVKAMFVWIPRYEYKIGAKEEEIEVNFISGKGTNATEGYTIHPAFTFGEDELTGIWVGKFEISTDKNNACYETPSVDNCDNTNQDPYILPNVSSLRYQYIVNQLETAKKFNDYIIDADSHMMKNSEWGAVAYLSQSKYGKYGNPDYEGANKEIYQNKSSLFITGSSNGTPSQDEAISTQYTYDVELNGTGASTTGTIYGIYDMSGGANDRVMGNYSGIASNSGLDESWFTIPNNVKYCDIYIIDNTDSCKDEECKGHALGETAGWYGDNASFVNSSYPWFYRGGEYNVDANGGIFYFGGYYGNSHGNGSFHVVISPNI